MMILNILPQNAFSMSLKDVIVLPSSSMVENKIEELNDLVASAQCSLGEAKQFLDSFIFEINHQYGMNLTLVDACHLLKQNIHQLGISLEMQEPFLKVIDLFEAENLPDFISTEGSLAQHTWHYNFYWPWEWNYFGLNKKKHESKHSALASVLKKPELELPNHMAIGFALALSGALVFILPLPGAQAVGVEMVTAGGIFFLEGMASGERPYHIDSKTGIPLDP